MAGSLSYMRCEIAKKDSLYGGTEGDQSDWFTQGRPQCHKIGEQVPSRPHDSAVDGLDATAEALRHAAEDTPTGALPDDVEKVPVFDRADLSPKI